MAPDRGVKRRERKVSVLQPKALMMKTKPKKGVETTQQASVRKQIRNLQRLLRRDLSQEVRQAQEKRLKDLQGQISSGSRLKHDRAMSEKYKKVRFFERRKVERRIRRAEKELRSAPDEDSKREAADRLRQLKQDLEYVRFFPKTEKYVSLFMSNDDKQAVARREKLRESIAANVAAAAAAGIELEDTGSEGDFTVDMTQDDFFLQAGSEDEEDGSAEFKDALHTSVTTNSKPTKQIHQIGANNNNFNSATGKRRSQNQTHKQEKRDRPSLGASSVLTRNKQQEHWHYHPGPIGRSQQQQQQQQHHENANHAEKEKRKRKRKRPPKK